MKKLLILAVFTLVSIAMNAVTIPYSQNFDEFTLPDGWTQTYSGSLGSDCWSVSGSNDAGGSPNEMLASYQYAMGTSRLISPPIDTQGLPVIALSFLHLYDDYGIGVTAKIQYSHDLINWFDASWSILGGYGDVSGSVNIFIMGMENEPVTYVAWVIEGDHYQFDYWYVDNVNILHPPLHEVAAISIDMPAVGNSEPMIPQATFGNNGMSIETFDATIQIGSYTDTQTITDLFPGTTQPVFFEYRFIIQALGERGIQSSENFIYRRIPQNPLQFQRQGTD